MPEIMNVVVPSGRSPTFTTGSLPFVLLPLTVSTPFPGERFTCTRPLPSAFHEVTTGAATAGWGVGAGWTGAGVVGERHGACRAPKGRQAIRVLDRAEHGVVVDLFRVAAARHVRAVKDRGNVIAAAAVILVPRDDQQAVVRLGPLGVGVDVCLGPC